MYYDQYSERIYNLLNQYLPGISSKLDSINSAVGDIFDIVSSFTQFLNDYKILLMIIAAVLLLGRFVSKEWLS